MQHFLSLLSQLLFTQHFLCIVLRSHYSYYRNGDQQYHSHNIYNAPGHWYYYIPWQSTSNPRLDRKNHPGRPCNHMAEPKSRSRLFHNECHQNPIWDARTQYIPHEVGS